MTTKQEKSLLAERKVDTLEQMCSAYDCAIDENMKLRTEIFNLEQKLSTAYMLLGKQMLNDAED